MDHSQYANQPPNYTQYPSAYADPYGQHQQYQQQYYQPTPPSIRNPFAPPPPAQSLYASHNAKFDPEHAVQVAQWQSAYAPQDQFDRGKKPGGKSENPNLTPIGARAPATSQTVITAAAEPANTSTKAGEDEKNNGKTKTVVRKGGGQSWEDSTLLEWDPTQFRIMVGNLAGEVTDDSLAKAFAQYGVAKARVVRDKRTTKSKGYGFVSFTDGELGFKAAREMTGKYIGSHPVTIQRSKTDIRPSVQKDRSKGKNHKGKGKSGQNDEDPLRANTGAHIVKKPVKNHIGMKVLG